VEEKKKPSRGKSLGGKDVDRQSTKENVNKNVLQSRGNPQELDEIYREIQGDDWEGYGNSHKINQHQQ